MTKKNTPRWTPADRKRVEKLLKVSAATARRYLNLGMPPNGTKAQMLAWSDANIDRRNAGRVAVQSNAERERTVKLKNAKLAAEITFKRLRRQRKTGRIVCVPEMWRVLNKELNAAACLDACLEKCVLGSTEFGLMLELHKIIETHCFNRKVKIQLAYRTPELLAAYRGLTGETPGIAEIPPETKRSQEISDRELMTRLRNAKTVEEIKAIEAANIAAARDWAPVSEVRKFLHALVKMEREVTTAWVPGLLKALPANKSVMVHEAVRMNRVMMDCLPQAVLSKLGTAGQVSQDTP